MLESLLEFGFVVVFFGDTLLFLGTMGNDPGGSVAHATAPALMALLIGFVSRWFGSRETRRRRAIRVAFVAMILLSGMTFVRRMEEVIGRRPRPKQPPVFKLTAPTLLAGGEQGSETTPRIESNKGTYREGEIINMIFEGFPGNRYDRMAIVPYNASEDTKGVCLFLRGQRSGKAAFPGLRPGQYEIRGYSDPTGQGGVRVARDFLQVKEKRK